MALVTVDAVVDVSRYLIVLEIVRVVSAMATGALKDCVVVRVDVAGGANIVGSAMACRERRVLRVVECRTGPGVRVMAVLARSGEELRLGRVSRIRRLGVVVLMAAVARGWQRRVVAVDVAIGALTRWYGVRAREGEGCVVVIERGVRPHIGVMAEFARGREARGLVRRAIGTLVVLLVTRVAKRSVQRIVIVGMAIAAKARRDSVRPCQLKTGAGMVELAIGPLNGVVAAFTRGRKSGGEVIHRRQGIGVVLLVATHTC